MHKLQKQGDLYSPLPKNKGKNNVSNNPITSGGYNNSLININLINGET